MRNEEAYRLSLYEDLGFLNEEKQVRLKRHSIDGTICVEKHVSAEAEGVYLFIKEINSSYMPQLYECIKEKDRLILIEEYISGRTLEDLIHADEINEECAAGIILELCHALKPLHQAKPPIICRDLKADNIMIDNQGNLKIVDFDIARVYEKGKSRDTRLLGTAEYAAPEQYGFSQTDQRTDIYALGVLLNYMLVKRYPVEQTASGASEQIIRKCISMEPQNRYQSVERLEEAVRKQYPQICDWNYKDAEKLKCQRETDRMKDEHMQKEREALRENQTWRMYLPPGFRSGIWWRMLIAGCGYAVLTVFCFSLTLTREGAALTGGLLWLERTLIWLSQMAFIAFVCNYGGCRDRIRILHPKNPMFKVLLFAVAEVVLFVAAAFAAAVIEMLFF